jgi:ankyrin repeat domain-containing protein 50
MNLNVLSTAWFTPLMIAIDRGLFHIVRELLKYSMVDVDAESDSGKAALILASEEGPWEVVHQLLNCSSKVNVNAQDNNNRFALVLASKRGPAQVVRELLTDKNLHVNWAGVDRQNALIWACVKGCEGVAEELLNHEGLDVYAGTNNGQTPSSWRLVTII